MPTPGPNTSALPGRQGRSCAPRRAPAANESSGPCSRVCAYAGAARRKRIAVSCTDPSSTPSPQISPAVEHPTRVAAGNSARSRPWNAGSEKRSSAPNTSTSCGSSAMHCPSASGTPASRGIMEWITFMPVCPHVRARAGTGTGRAASRVPRTAPGRHRNATVRTVPDDVLRRPRPGTSPIDTVPPPARASTTCHRRPRPHASAPRRTRLRSTLHTHARPDARTTVRTRPFRPT